MRLDDIGFYTLTDARAKSASEISRLSRGEIVLGARCNFHCPYCRHVGGKDMEMVEAEALIRRWAADKLFAIRFSGGEPTLPSGVARFVCIGAETRHP